MEDVGRFLSFLLAAIALLLAVCGWLSATADEVPSSSSLLRGTARLSGNAH